MNGRHVPLVDRTERLLLTPSNIFIVNPNQPSGATLIIRLHMQNGAASTKQQLTKQLMYIHIYTLKVDGWATRPPCDDIYFLLGYYT